ncbi:MAG: hypothetical protein K8M05_01170 [Deltaproteobacteria bacterium]|nr:hypothetical protein [Kofleriaceae bacterium]
MTDPTQTRGGKRPRLLRFAGSAPQLVVGLCVLFAASSSADAQPAKKPPPDKVEPGTSAPGAPKGKPKVFDFTGLDISGRLRTPQLLYFLDRATEELERASLERRSFIPEMVRSVDEGPL